MFCRNESLCCRKSAGEKTVIQEWVISSLIALGTLLLLIFGGFLYFCSKEGQRWAIVTVYFLVGACVLAALTLKFHQLIFAGV